jgi:hypothetical protein
MLAKKLYKIYNRRELLNSQIKIAIEMLGMATTTISLA